MKRYLIIICFFMGLCSAEAQEQKSGVDNLWLSGINVLTGKGVDIYNLPGSPLMNYLSPESIKCHQDGTVTVAFRKYISSQTKPRTFTWRMSPAAQELIRYAVRNHQWVNIIADEIIGMATPNSNAAIVLEPYNFESADSVGGTIPEKALDEWSKIGITFPMNEVGDAETTALCPCLLAVENGNAIIQTEGTSLFSTKEGKAYFTIKNVSAPALQLLRFAVKNQAILHFTYDKNTKAVSKLQLDPEWDKSFIVG